MKSILVSMLLVISSLTALFAQTGDTITCYTNKELKKIATRIIRANECDTLLSLANQTIDNQQLQINNLVEQVCTQDSIITLKTATIADYEQILVFKDEQLAKNEKQIASLTKKAKWIKTGWAATGILSIVLILIAAF